MKWTALLLTLLLAACGTSADPSQIPPDEGDRLPIALTAPSGKKVVLSVESANEPEARARGLMFRESLPQDGGMLFTFGVEQPLAFWMKNTLIPLDVIFFDASGAYVSHATMTPCTADPCPGYPSARPARWALEVNAGLAEQWGVGEGWTIEMTQ